MNKDNVKMLVLAFAAILAIWIIYKTLSAVSENKTTAAAKRDLASADLEIKKEQDAYIAEREDQTKQIEAQKIEYLEKSTKAEGYETLEEYLAKFPTSEKNKYLMMRNEYIRVMGVDPGIIRHADLSAWYSNYQAWKGWNAEYLRLTGESKSFLDPDFDEAQEMEAAVVSAKAAIEEANRLMEQQWIDEYELFCNDHDGYKGCPYISLADCKKWLDHPSQLEPLQEYLTGKYDAFFLKKEKLDKAYLSLKKYFDGGYINWHTSREKYVRGAKDLPDGTYKEVDAFTTNDMCYAARLLRNDGGVNIYSRVKSNKPEDKVNYTNFLDASLAVAQFQYAYEEGRNILGAILSFGISAAIEKNHKVRDYMPARLNELMSKIEYAYTQTYTPFGNTAEELRGIVLPFYSQGLYGFDLDALSKIANNKTTILKVITSSKNE